MITVDAAVWVAAADPEDAHATPSREFFRVVDRDGLSMHVPALARLEIACALSRRLRAEGPARRLAGAMFETPGLIEVPMDGALMEKALGLGPRLSLRGADALYAATAELSGTSLVTWDRELIERAAGITPPDWLLSREAPRSP